MHVSAKFRQFLVIYSTVFRQ